MLDGIGKQRLRLRIGIIGAGFSGTALIAALRQAATFPVEIYLFEKSGEFAAGPAYRTSLPFHLLNARARDMSALESDKDHFTTWLRQHHDEAEDAFVPRFLYRDYLQAILKEICDDKSSLVTVKLVQSEVNEVMPLENAVSISTSGGQTILVDKAVLATGVAPANNAGAMIQPWNYEDVQKIPADNDVLIMGTGLSMVDAVQTLHYQKHRGSITAVSRRGLLPLPHAEHHVAINYIHGELPANILQLSRRLRRASDEFSRCGGDWRTIMNTLRPRLPALWKQLDITERKRFLRHMLPYWNVHRHRVHDKVYALLQEMQAAGRLQVMAGRIQEILHQEAVVRLRQSDKIIKVPAQSIINCMGFTFAGSMKQQALIASLIKQGHACIDELGLGFIAERQGALKDKNGNPSQQLFTIGPPLQGESWETVAVPEIRKQCVELTECLLAGYCEESRTTLPSRQKETV